MKELDFPTKKKNILAKRGINTEEDLLNFLPRDYIDFTHEYERIDRSLAGATGCFIGSPYKYAVKYQNNRSIITFKIQTADEKHINVCIIGANYLKAYLERLMLEDKICVFGKLSYEEPYGFSILSPSHVTYCSERANFAHIEPIYTKFDGIGSEWLNEQIGQILALYKYDDVDNEILLRHGFDYPSTKRAYNTLHNPQNLMDIEYAKERIKFNKLLSFSMSLIKQSKKEAKGTAVILDSLKITKDIVSSLPYSLSDDQRKYLNEMILKIRDGKRVNGLLQGDVGCGKTIVAILMLFAMAENGYQGALMAPTSILASQHFAQVKEVADKFGINAAYIDGSTKASEKNKIYKGLESGEIKIVVGTHSLTNNKLVFNNLGLVIIDEEHRFGVEQRNSLLSYAKNGVNTIVMSATPMPRTLAGALHSSTTDIYDIHTMPVGRIPVATGIADDENRVFDYINRQVIAGRQAYVICPLIDENEELPIRSVAETEKIYKDRFPKLRIDSINGKMSQEEIQNKIIAFKNKEFDILITTTIVEVGVNVPNATVIVIQNAERFGLAQLHQLRGRVGRGEYKSCCVLLSSEKDNPRLNALVSSTDGFKIAEEDLRLRGAGDLIGVKQSGFTEIMELIAENPKYYDRICALSKELSETDFVI